ncbi:putative cohesin complex subunit [Protomyces lactucae-debilis]|uniref:Structural maintenance of chromosomes protein n=1 Tax=Protomyces lactucae-debilis TaxID=2754530 RepID=A0A1Y2F7E3_PROLT|nr:putative cohesin complex subunit [Protomyces lactucae-debilis]ORY79404.1 putative cohesin complex subunit [Protomyces lactucae-debilis]
MGRLVQIELCDFKSYKGHQTIGPFRSFSSICGPNGAGKSNLMDAISFVLGIKSSHLRSSHLKDLVYRGNAAEEDDPTTAWVMAVYEDDEGKETCFKRIINANGSSDYKIDTTSCTAKQYNAVLESHNVLIKARNFLVFQGDVEAIASQSPKDMTKLVEQISGSLDYKVEYERLKLEQEKATEANNFNFHQKRSMTAELRSFQEQQAEAEAYDNKVAEREQAILVQVLWRLFHIQVDLDRNDEQLETNMTELVRMETETEKLVKSLHDAEKKRAKELQTVEKMQRHIKRRQQAQIEKQPAVDAIQERIKSTEKSIKALTARLASVSPVQEKQVRAIQSLEGSISSVEKAQRKFEQDQAKLEREAGNLTAAQVDEYRRLKLEANKQSARERTEFTKVDRELRGVSENLMEAREQTSDHERKKAALEDDAESMQRRKDDLEDQLSAMKEDLDALYAKLRKIQSTRAAGEAKEKDLNDKLHDTLEKLSQHNDQERETTKEVQFKENVAAMRKIFPGVKGRLTDLCRPTQRKYDIAIATIFGRNNDAIVVDTERTGKECIEYMREQRAGVATFLPLDTLTVRAINAELRSVSPQAKLAMDVIQYEASLERAMQYACGSAIVCETLDVARRLCYEERLEVKAVTLDGTVIHKSGNLTGGQHENRGAASRWTDSQVEGLRRLRDSLMSQIQTLYAARQQDTGEDAMQSELRQIEARRSLLQADAEAIGRDLEARQYEARHEEAEIEKLAPTIKQLEKEHAALQKKADALQKTLHTAEDAIFAGFCKSAGLRNIRQYEATQGALMQEASKKKAEFTSQLARLRNQLAFEQDLLKETLLRVRKIEASIKRDKDALDGFKKEERDLQNDMSGLEKEVSDLQSKYDAERKKADGCNAAVNEATRTLNNAQRELEHAAKAVSACEAATGQLLARRHVLLRRCKLEEIDLPLTKGRLDNVPLAENLTEDAAEQPDIADWGIEIDFEELDDDLKQDGSESVDLSLTEQIRELEADLERMVPNTKAHERVAGVEERLRSTEKEFEKSRKKAKQLKDNFNRVKQKRLDLFTKAYEHISGQIDKIYKDLTKSKHVPLGGTAYLSLEDDEEPFSHGVKYHAMPPGKRFRDMEQLSGGEKTIAALALLFAIHSFQPSPFFVLDEVDAALDNANVAKVANYIREHAGHGLQFVVISLKNALYHQSQGLVGIYRDQEENSSKSLTLDLEAYDQAQVV